MQLGFQQSSSNAGSGGGTKGATGLPGSTGLAGATGSQGETGVVGPAGLTGSPGIQGVTGHMGPDGVEGHQGATGVDGATGVQGVAGSTGELGLQGSTGFQGITGVAGTTGFQGVTGAVGPTGSQGATGLNGSQGITGDQGLRGTTGNQGLTGTVGPQGGTGLAGVLGSTGFQGTTGLQGIIGEQGATGSTGAQGSTGFIGLTGIQGTQGLTGNDGTSGTTGVAGVQGVTGANGLTGTQGTQGVTGVKGAQGSTGSDGTQGVTGLQGVQGTTGTQGEEGATGYSGVQGVTGAEGTQGTTGADGLSGITGFEGVQGTTGLQGITGTTGLQGTTGQQGPQGLTGVAGEQGITGYVGITGYQGITGAPGSGNTGVQGTQGDTGVQGVTGEQGATGLAGYTGIQGAYGVTGSQGVTGAASSVIGAAEDGDYTDGLFVDFVPSTPIGTAVDRFNEVLKSLAPSPAPALADISIGTLGVAGKLSFGASNVISGYTSVPTKDINSSIGSSESIVDSSDTIVLKGIFNASTAMAGNLADAILAGPGTPTPAYPAKSFGDGSAGSVELWLNGVRVAAVDLTSTTNSIIDTNASAVLFVTAATANKFPNGTSFDVFRYRTGTWQILAAGQRLGYNRMEVRRVDGTTVVSNRFGWVVDASVTATSFASESLSGLSMTGSKYLSGVNHHTAGTAVYSVTASNVHRNTYSSVGTAISHTGTRCSLVSSALASILAESDTEVVSKTATVVASPRILNQGLTVSTTVDRTVQTDLTSTGTSAYSLLLDATAPTGTAVLENMDDELFRVASNLNVLTTSGYDSVGGSPSDWVSTNSLVSATAGYSDGLLVHNGLLQYPTKGTNSGNFAGIADGPVGNVNYSAAGGTRTYLRYFYDTSPRQNFRLAATVTGTAFVSVATGPSGNNLTLEVLAPNTTSNGSATVWKDAVVAYTNDSSVGCYASSFGSTVPTSWGMTLGGKNTSTSGFVVVLRITASSAWTGSINTLQLTWL